LNKKITLLGVILAMLFLVGCSGQNIELDHHGNTEDAISPENLGEHLFDKKILDIRSQAEYEKEHIEGSYVIPLELISESKFDTIGFEKGDDIIVYANSNIKANKAKTLLGVMGYEHVKVLNGGLVHWKEDGFKVVSGKMDIVFDEDEKETASSLIIEPSKYDFGIIDKKDGVVSTTFIIKNTGKKFVTIKETSTSCGCTSVMLSSKDIKPEETSLLEVSFDPNFHNEPQGKFSRTAFLQTSEGIELQAKINVEIKE